MVRALKIVLAAGVLLAGTVATTGAAQAAQAAQAVQAAEPAARSVSPMSCGAQTTGAVFGGYRTRMVCNSRQIDGFGSTVAAAQQNANDMYAVAVSTGVYCFTASLPQSVYGGYRVGLSCNNRAVHGHGTTLTDAGRNGRDLATTAGWTGLYCNQAGVYNVSGGYRVRLACVYAVDGHGTTLTAAADNAAALARLAGDTGVYCLVQNHQAIGGGYRTALSCNSRAVHGVGTTVTDSGHNALGFARIFAANGRYCSNAGVQPITGGYRVTVLCSPTGGYLHGQGVNVTAAGEAARVAAS